MEQMLCDLARKDILRRYDTAKDIRIHANFAKETYKHVMLPVYAVTYHYKNKVYNVLINGQTGKIKGEYPKSVVKIILIIIAAAAVIFGFIYASAGSERYDRYNQAYGSYYVEAAGPEYDAMNNTEYLQEV
jgi:hypothetical protein